MAIAKMLKMKLVGVADEQDALLNALHKTGAVELKECEPMFEGKKVPSDLNEVSQKRGACENALNIITRFAKKRGIAVEADGFAVSYDEFMGVSLRADKILAAAQNVAKLFDEYNELGAKTVALKNEKAGYEVYLPLKSKFSDYKNTQKTRAKLGVLDNRGYLKLCAALSEKGAPLMTVINEGGDKHVIVSVIYHVQYEKQCEQLLSAAGFSVCSYFGDYTAGEKLEKIAAELSAANNARTDIELKICSLNDDVRDLKLLSDYYCFCEEKLSAASGFLRTSTAFLLEAYVPEKRKSEVLNAVSGVTRACYTEFIEIKEDEFAPTLMRNKKVSSQFEFVTNLYSPPKYLSLDPNGIMGLFFAVFLGFINADVGYGLLMVIGGFLFAAKQKQKQGSMAKLARVLAYSGVFTIIFGFLVDSLFGIPFMRDLGWIAKPILPDPISDFSSLAGIQIPTMLLISLGMGVIHIMVGLFLASLVHFKHGRVWDGIFDGIVWDIMLAGLIVAVLGMIGVLSETAITAGAIAAVAAVAVGALTAGRHQRGFGKFTKGFGAVYGLINYLSDILSYARLYGLMLSGAQIASIVSNSLAVPMLTSPGGVGGIIACALIMLAGHAFNIAMGLLGAFIHDARLQYVEFFSRFYEGEGELFTPMGTKLSHVYLD